MLSGHFILCFSGKGRATKIPIVFFKIYTLVLDLGNNYRRGKGFREITNNLKDSSSGIIKKN